MFGHRFFGARYFGARYFGDGGTIVVVVAAVMRIVVADVLVRAAGADAAGRIVVADQNTWSVPA